MSILAGQEVTADDLNALGNRVAEATVASAADTTAQTIIGTFTIPAGDPGLVLNGGYRLVFFGQASCTGTPALQLEILDGIGGSTIFNGGTITCQSGGTGMKIVIDLDIMITAAGALGTFDCMGTMRSALAATSVAFVGSGSIAKAINTTEPQTFVVVAQWSAASASNVCQGDTGAIDRI